jgi:hypothetical protein
VLFSLGSCSKDVNWSRRDRLPRPGPISGGALGHLLKHCRAASSNTSRIAGSVAMVVTTATSASGFPVEQTVELAPSLTAIINPCFTWLPPHSGHRRGRRSRESGSHVLAPARTRSYNPTSSLRRTWVREDKYACFHHFSKPAASSVPQSADRNLLESNDRVTARGGARNLDEALAGRGAGRVLCGPRSR